MAKETLPGLVLPAEAVSSSEAQVFGGFPGVYVPGEAVAIETLGLTRDEARERVKELGLPLKEARAEAPEAEQAAAVEEAPASEGPEAA
ncbi:MAG: hypothetical protein ACRDY6_13745 [Acidimicrobiia bacterium]